MNRKIALVGVLLIGLLLSACGGNAPTRSAGPLGKLTPLSCPLVQATFTGPATITVDGVEYEASTGARGPLREDRIAAAVFFSATGKQLGNLASRHGMFYVAGIVVKNVGNGPVNLDHTAQLHWGGKTYNHDEEAEQVLEKAGKPVHLTRETSLNPEDEAIWYAVFDVPEIDNPCESLLYPQGTSQWKEPDEERYPLGMPAAVVPAGSGAEAVRDRAALMALLSPVQCPAGEAPFDSSIEVDSKWYKGFTGNKITYKGIPLRVAVTYAGTYRQLPSNDTGVVIGYAVENAGTEPLAISGTRVEEIVADRAPRSFENRPDLLASLGLEETVDTLGPGEVKTAFFATTLPSDADICQSAIALYVDEEPAVSSLTYPVEGFVDSATSPPLYSPLLGEYKGTYEASQGVTGLTLEIYAYDGEYVDAIFTFYPVPENPDVGSGTYRMYGWYDEATGRLRLKGDEWIDNPAGYTMLDLTATIDESMKSITGRVHTWWGEDVGPLQVSR